MPSDQNTRKVMAERTLQFLRSRWPSPRPHLNAASPWQLLVATMLSAQCTDARVNSITPALFARWPGPQEIAGASQSELEQQIRSAGFFSTKARNIIASAKIIMDQHAGQVPHSMAELLTLPGVARKTANVVLWGAFGINEGLAVDTHVTRIAFRLGLTEARQANKIEQDLLLLFPRESWGDVNHTLVSFGRELCRARTPLCELCELAAHCPRHGLTQ